MVNVTQNDKVYEIKFKYDPMLISLVKAVPGRRYDPNRKLWTIPLNHLGMFYAQIKGTPYEDQVNIKSDEHLDENDTINLEVQIPDIDVSNIDFHVKDGCHLYKHQIDFMKFAIDREQKGNMSGFLLCDEQGLGKTAMAAVLAMYNKDHYRLKHCLIICCVNSSKYHWKDDIDKLLGEEAYILGTRKIKRGQNKGGYNYTTGSKEKLEDLRLKKMYGEEDGEDLPFFIIMNIEGLRARENRRYALTDELIGLINDGYIGMIAIDEVHKNCSPSAIQGRQLVNIKKKTGKKCMWLPITGTPIVNKPTDVYLPLKLVDGHDYKDYWTWCQNFCCYGGFNDKEIVGYKNIPVLKGLLQGNMIRRLKDDVVDLPPKLYYTEYVENSPYQTKLYQDVSNNLMSERDEIVRSLNPLAKMMRLRQVNGSPELVDENLSYEDKNYVSINAKLKRLLELLEEIHDRHEKVVVFSNWVEPLRMIYYFIYKKYPTRCFTGTMKETDRQKNLDQFKNDSKYMVLLGTIDALGVSQNLEVSNNIIFYDEPWTVASFEQCCDRCHRITTTKPVNIYTLISKNTIDEKVDNLLYRKKGISSFIVDNIDIHSNPDLFDFLLGN